jgi:hypothetical protein
MSAPLASFHATKASSTTFSSGNSGRLEWDTWETRGPLAGVFEDGTLNGPDLTDVKLLLRGWYSVHCWAQWSTSFTGYTSIAMIHDDTDISEPRLSQGEHHPQNFSSESASAFQVVRYLPPYSRMTEPPNFAWIDRLEFWIVQDSGSNRNVQDALLEIAYWGGAETTTVALDPGDQPSAPDTPAQGIAFGFDSDTFATPVWERVDVT